MNGQDIRETMGQIHLPEQVKEEMTMSIQKRLTDKTRRAKSRRKFGFLKGYA